MTAIERAGIAMMRTKLGRRLLNTFTDEEIRALAKAAIEASREG